MKLKDKVKMTARLLKRVWTAPSDMDDEHYWGDGSGYGQTQIRDSLMNPMSQIEQFKSWVYICVNYNAKSVARQRLRLYQAVKAGAPKLKGAVRAVPRELKTHLYANAGLDPYLRKSIDLEEITDHPLLTMMRKVNPVLNQSDFWMLTETYMGLTGASYWLKRENVFGVPYQIWMLESQLTRPKTGLTLDEYIKYFIYRQGLKDKYFDAEEVVYHKYPNPLNPVTGLSPLAGLTDSVLVNEDIYRYERAQFKNNARPDTVMTFPETVNLTDDEFKRTKAEWNEVFRGTKRSGQLAILEGGADIKPFSFSPKELSHLEGRKSTREEVAGGLGVPVALLTPNDVNLSNAKTAYSQYMRDTIDPKLKMYEQTMNAELVPDYDDAENIFFAFDNPIPGDNAMALKERSANIASGYSSINQERAKDGEEPVDWGDVPILPANMIPVGTAPQPQAGKSMEELNDLAELLAEELHARLM